MFGDLGKDDMENARPIVREAVIPILFDALNSKEDEMVTAVSYVIQCLQSQVELSTKWQGR